MNRSLPSRLLLSAVCLAGAASLSACGTADEAPVASSAPDAAGELDDLLYSRGEIRLGASPTGEAETYIAEVLVPTAASDVAGTLDAAVAELAGEGFTPLDELAGGAPAVTATTDEGTTSPHLGDGEWVIRLSAAVALDGDGEPTSDVALQYLIESAEG